MNSGKCLKISFLGDLIFIKSNPIFNFLKINSSTKELVDLSWWQQGLNFQLKHITTHYFKNYSYWAFCTCQCHGSLNADWCQPSWERDCVTSVQHIHPSGLPVYVQELWETSSMAITVFAAKAPVALPQAMTWGSFGLVNCTEIMGSELVPWPIDP